MQKLQYKDPWNLIVEKYKKVDGGQKITFFSSLFWGLLAHIYMMTNKLPNHDDLWDINGYGMSSSLGRWTLARVGNLAKAMHICFSLPWINGLFSILLIAISACMVISLFKINNKGICMLIGGLMVTFPAWTFTFFFMFTAPYYAMALFLSVACVWITDRFKHGWIAGLIFMVMSVGIYQSYIAVGSILVVIFFIKLLIENNKLQKIHWIKALKMIIMLAGAMMLYISSLKVYEMIPEHDLEEYKGISDMASGNGSMLFELPGRLEIIYSYFFSLFTSNKIEMTSYRLVNILLAVMFAVTIFLMIILIKKNDCSPVNMVLTAICVIVMPICTLPLYLVVSEVADVYSLMLYSVVGVYIFVLVIADMSVGILRTSDSDTDKSISANTHKNTYKKTGHVIRISMWFTQTACFVIILLYVYYANAQYLAADLSIKEAESYYTTMITSIKMQEGYRDDMHVVIVGSTITDESVYENEKMSFFANSARPESLVNAYSRQRLMEDYLGFKNECVYATGETAQKYATELASMACYPDSGSIKIVGDDVVLVRLE